MAPSTRPIDFLVIVPLEEEREAVLQRLPAVRQLPPDAQDIRIYYESRLPFQFSDGTKGEYGLIITSPLGMGRLESAHATSDAIRRFHPRYVLLVGIVGGVGSRVALGDVVIGEQFVDYELQKITDAGADVRYQAHRADPRLLTAAQHLREWQAAIKEPRPVAGMPRRHIGPVASGDKVMAAGNALARYLRDWPKLVGVEMEAAGVASAAFQAPSQPGVLMIRSVSDLADPDKGTASVEAWRGYACDAAAAFTMRLLESGPVPLATVPVEPLAPVERQGLPRLAPVERQDLSGLRDLIRKVLVTDSDFDAFCLDYFRTVYSRFSSGMERTAKINLLLASEDEEEILQKLRSSDPARFAKYAQSVKRS